MDLLMPSKPRPGKRGLPAKQGELTSKQTGFALDVGVKGLSLTDAYRANYCADNMTINSIYVEACKLAANPKVNQGIRELQKHKLKALSITGDSLMLDVHELSKHSENDLVRYRAVANLGEVVDAQMFIPTSQNN